MKYEVRSWKYEVMSEYFKAWAFLVLMGALVYGCAAFSRPHEPAGRALHEALNSLPPVCE